MKIRHTVTMFAFLAVLAASLQAVYPARAQEGMKDAVETFAFDLHAGMQRANLTPQQKEQIRTDLQTLRQAKQSGDRRSAFKAMMNFRSDSRQRRVPAPGPATHQTGSAGDSRGETGLRWWGYGWRHGRGNGWRDGRHALDSPDFVPFPLKEKEITETRAGVAGVYRDQPARGALQLRSRSRPDGWNGPPSAARRGTRVAEVALGKLEIVVFGVVLLLGGCMLGPDFSRPPAPVAGKWIEAGDAGVDSQAPGIPGLVDGLQRSGVDPADQSSRTSRI